MGRAGAALLRAQEQDAGRHLPAEGRGAPQTPHTQFCRGTSHIRNRTLPRTLQYLMPRVLGGLLGGVRLLVSEVPL